MHRFGWIRRVGAVTLDATNKTGRMRGLGAAALGAMFLTTGCGLLFSSPSHKPTPHSAAASSTHAAGGSGASQEPSHQSLGGSAGHVGTRGLPAGRGGDQNGTKALAAGRVGGQGAGRSQSSTARSQTQGGSGGSASSVANAVQSLFGQIGAPQTAKTHTAGTGAGATGAATARTGGAPSGGAGGAATGGASGAGSASGGASGSHSPSHGGSSPTRAGGKAARPSEADIVQPYVAQLQSLRSQYLGSLSSLYNQARTDYRQGKGSKVAIEAKFVPQLVSLENSAQDQVNGILFALRDHLQAHGYPTTEMNTLRSDFYSQVQQEIAALRG